MVKLPLGVDIDNLIKDLINFSWEASEILLYYSQILKDSDHKNNLIKLKDNKDPVTLADIKVNELNVRRRVFGLAPGVPSLNPHRSVF